MEKAAVRQGIRLGATPTLAAISGRSRAKLERYRRDPIAFISRLQVWNQLEARYQPFDLWPSQEELLRAWIDFDSLHADDLSLAAELRFSNTLCEKSRRMGDTVVIAGAFLWIVTHWDAPMLMQHQDLQEVSDSGPTWDSFFGKIKAMHDTQPWEIGKAPLHFVGGNNPLIRNTAHPVRFITGEGQTADPGRGGGYSGAFIDEAARIRYDTQGQAALSRACPNGRLMLSTPFGRGNVYYRLRQDRPAGWKFVDHHWSKHPAYAEGAHIAALAPSREGPGGIAPQPSPEMRAISLRCPLCAMTMAGVPWDAKDPRSHRFPGKLTSPWYDAAVIELTREQVAEELDIDYSASLTARVYEEFDEQVHVIDRIPYDPALPLEFSFDYGWDVTHVGVWQDGHDCLRKIGEVEATETLPEDVADDIRAVLRRLGVPENGVSNRDITRTYLCVGDPSGEGTQLNTGESLTSDYWRAGFTIGNPGSQLVATTIKAVKRLLDGRPKPIRYSRAGCPATILHMQQNRWPTNAQGERRPGSMRPLDDEHNHACRADAYYATYKYPPPAESSLPDPNAGRQESLARAVTGSGMDDGGGLSSEMGL